MSINYSYFNSMAFTLYTLKKVFVFVSVLFICLFVYLCCCFLYNLTRSTDKTTNNNDGGNTLDILHSTFPRSKYAEARNACVCVCVCVHVCVFLSRCEKQYVCL